MQNRFDNSMTFKLVSLYWNFKYTLAHLPNTSSNQAGFSSDFPQFIKLKVTILFLHFTLKEVQIILKKMYTEIKTTIEKLFLL